ncbi:MAG: hypothetical protein KDJ31_01070 [Candidatus Competibacteraceae bacterium]|nr:hypothetical protein [Candidatus Competibacteraceae bacterium]MCB1820214.1 hypothetical protein [Candidatus Competibacteraceae bacterium]
MRLLALSLLRVIVLLPSYLLVLLIRLIKWLIAPPALLLQMAIGIPLGLLRVRQPMRPHLLLLSEADLPDTAWIAMTDATEALTVDDFVHQGDFRCDEVIPNAVLWLRLLTQSAQGIGAMIAYVEFGKGGPPCQRFIEFSTEFDDGRALTTNNLNLPYSLPAPAYLARLQLKDVWDPRALYIVHRQLVASLSQPVNRASLEQVIHDPASRLLDAYAREMTVLIQQGWMRQVTGQSRVCASFRGALRGVWRQAWPLASLHLRAADRRSRQLLAEHGINADAFTGGAISIVVDRQPMPPEAGIIATVSAGHDYAQSLALRTDPGAVLESVVVELDHDADGNVFPREFRYSFRSCKHQSARRIRRLSGFDVLIDPSARLLAVTAMEREAEQADDDSAWQSMLLDSPLQPPLRPGPWLRDLDTILPVALEAFQTRADTRRIDVDSASLYANEEGILRWQVVAWLSDETPVHVMLNARTGAIDDI